MSSRFTGSCSWSLHRLLIPGLLIGFLLIVDSSHESVLGHISDGVTSDAIPDLDTAASGAIDTNLINTDVVGPTGRERCRDLGN